ncbi:MAG: Na/Pi cotransporter family protein [Opitutales bacterium]
MVTQALSYLPLATATAPGEASLSWWSIGMGLLGGLALFLYGLRIMTDNLAAVAGSRMKQWLSKLTANRFFAVAGGTVITAIIQSSSVTTVLVVGFISAGLMTFKGSIPVILGAGLGTTVTAQIIAFKVTQYALLMVAAGFFLNILARRRSLKQHGMVVLGLGILFFGMNLMSEATYPLRDYPPFIDMLRQLENPLLGILVAAVFTALVQSSSATTGIVIILSSQGVLTLEAGIALIFGANIGTCVTAGVAAFGKPRDAVRAAVVHVLIKVIGVAAWITFIPEFAQLIQWISPGSTDLEQSARAAADTPRQIANAHTLFNGVNTLVFLFALTPLHALVMKLVPDKAPDEDDPSQPRHLERLYLGQPDVALDAAFQEIDRLAEQVKKSLGHSFPAVVDGAGDDLDRLEAEDATVDTLHGHIVGYLSDLSRRDLSDQQASRLREALTLANLFESAGDVIENNLVGEGRDRLRESISISEGTREALKPVFEGVVEMAESARRSLLEDPETNGDDDPVQKAKEAFHETVDQANGRLSDRLSADAPDRLTTFRLETQIVEDYKRIHTLMRRAARVARETRAAVKENRQAIPQA